MQPQYQLYIESAKEQFSVSGFAQAKILVKNAIEEFVNETLMIGANVNRKVKSVKKYLPRKLSLDLALLVSKDEKFADKTAASILKKIKKENWHTLEIGWDPDKEDTAFIKAT
mgnify:FL=1